MLNGFCVCIYLLDGPPAYEKLFGVSKLKDDVMEAKTGSSNKGIFAVKLCSIFCGSGTVLPS